MKSLTALLATLVITGCSIGTSPQAASQESKTAHPRVGVQLGTPGNTLVFDIGSYAGGPHREEIEVAPPGARVRQPMVSSGDPEHGPARFAFAYVREDASGSSVHVGTWWSAEGSSARTDPDWILMPTPCYSQTSEDGGPIELTSFEFRGYDNPTVTFTAGGEEFVITHDCACVPVDAWTRLN